MSTATRQRRAGETSARVKTVLSALDAVYPVLQREADDGERLRRPTPAVHAGMRSSGIFSLLVPAELGGLDAGPLDVIEAVERVSHADASVGWIVRALISGTGYAAAYLGDRAAHELFVDGDALVAGQTTSFTGSARRVEDGYSVSGSWQFVPGLSMATHVHLAVTVEDTGEHLVCVVPRDALWISDNWSMLGLRATASFDVIAENVVVPDDYVFVPDGASRSGWAGRLSPALVAGLDQAAWAQGVARRMLDELRLLAQRRQAGDGSPLSSDEFFSEFGRRFSHERGTMALLRDTWREGEETVAAGRSLSTEQETMARLATSLATRTALEIGQLVHRFAGAHVMRDGPLQRFFRDSHAGTLHRGSAEVVAQQCGRILAGTVPEMAHWGTFDLVLPDDAARPVGTEEVGR